jgi:hypothetical protein
MEIQTPMHSPGYVPRFARRVCVRRPVAPGLIAAVLAGALGCEREVPQAPGETRPVAVGVPTVRPGVVPKPLPVAAAPTAAPAPRASPRTAGPPPRGKHVAILYSSNVRGAFEPCG